MQDFELKGAVQLKRWLENLVQFVRSGVERFWVSVCFLLVLFAIAAWQTFADWGYRDWQSDLCAKLYIVLTLGFLLQTLGTLLTERYSDVKNKALNVTATMAISVAVPLLYWVCTPLELNQWHWLMLGGQCSALSFLIVYFSYKNSLDEFGVHISHFVKTGFLSGVMTLVVLAGVCMCLGVVSALLFDIDWEWFSVVWEFCAIVLYPTFFLSMLPTEYEDYRTPKFLKGLFCYIMLPIYCFCLVILYLYIFKEIGGMDFSGEAFGEFVGIGIAVTIIGFFLYLVLDEYKEENAFVRFFKRFFGVAVIPFIVMQVINLGTEMTTAYLTTEIYMKSVAIIAEIAAVGFTFVKRGRFVPYMVFVCAAIAIVTSTGPFNVIDVVIRSQDNRIIAVLRRNDMLTPDMRVVAKGDISDEDKQVIRDAFNESFAYNEESRAKSRVMRDYEGVEFAEIFGFERWSDYADKGNTKRYVSYGTRGQGVGGIRFSVSGYDEIREFNYNEHNKYRESFEAAYEQEMQDFARALSSKYKDSNYNLNSSEMEIIGRDYKIIVTSISMSVDKAGVVEDVGASGYILTKEAVLEDGLVE